jgi:hypothetical protein
MSCAGIGEKPKTILGNTPMNEAPGPGRIDPPDACSAERLEAGALCRPA